MLMGDLKYGSYTPSRSPTVETLIAHTIGDLSELCRSVLEQKYDTYGNTTKAVGTGSGDGGGDDNAMEVDGAPEDAQNCTNHTDDNEGKRKDRLAKTGAIQISISFHR